MTAIQYSVVVPVFGAENALRKLHVAIQQFFEGKYGYEIVYVDDCSLDNSWGVLKELQQNNKNVTVIRLSKNFGQHAASVCGFKHAKGDFIITMDDDLEADPQQIEKLIVEQKREDFDLVYGVYKKLNASFSRGIFTKLYKLAAKVEGPEKGKGSSFRLVKSSLAKKIANNHRQFVFIDELCLWYTNKISFLDVPANANFVAKKRYKVSSLVKTTGTIIMFSSTVPLKLVTWLGGILSLVNFVFGIYFLIRKYFFKVEVPGYTSLIVSILFSTGIIILCIGVIAQYLSQALRSINNVPCYNEDEIIC